MFQEVAEPLWLPGHPDQATRPSGVNRPSPEVTAHHWDWTLNVNARGAWQCAKAALPLMQPRGGGSVVSISSLGASRVMKDYFPGRRVQGRARSGDALLCPSRWRPTASAGERGVRGLGRDRRAEARSRWGSSVITETIQPHPGLADGRARRSCPGSGVSVYPRGRDDPRANHRRRRRLFVARVMLRGCVNQPRRAIIPVRCFSSAFLALTRCFRHATFFRLFIEANCTKYTVWAWLSRRMSPRRLRCKPLIPGPSWSLIERDPPAPLAHAELHRQRKTTRLRPCSSAWPRT